MRLWTVARRELKSLFDLPTGYVLLVAFLALNGFLFFRSGVSGTSREPPSDAGPPALGVPLLRARGHHAVAGGGHSRRPARGGAVAAADRAGAAARQVSGVRAVPLDRAGPHTPHPAWRSPLARPCRGRRWPRSTWARASSPPASRAIGTWASSLSRSQITAFILGAVVMFLLILVGLNPLLVGLPAALAAVAARDRRAVPLRQHRPRGHRPAGRDLFPLARGDLPRPGVRRAAGTEARPRRRSAPPAACSASACWRPRSSW